MTFSGIILLAWRRKMCEENTKICHPLLGLPQQPNPNYKTCVISANYEPISTKFSEISVPASWQGIGEKYVEKCHPSWGCPTPHIFKYCQLLDITDNNERISMKFSGISLLARRRKWVKKTKYLSPPSWGCPS